MDNIRAADCAYPGLELLPDGTFVTTTYGHWIEGQVPFIVSVRFKMAELDAKAALLPKHTQLFYQRNQGLPRPQLPSPPANKKLIGKVW